MLGSDPTSLAPIDNVAHIIQVALTPIFFLSGIAALLNVFSSRLARVADRCHIVTAAMGDAPADVRDELERQLRFLNTRSKALDAAVVMGTIGGGATCAAALLLFVGSLRNSTIAGMLYLAFGLALLCTIGALLAFLVEMLMASRGLRERRDTAVRKARAEARDPAAVRP